MTGIPMSASTITWPIAKCMIGDQRHVRELLDEGIAQDPAPYQLYLNRALLELTQAQQQQDELPESACDDIDRAIERSPPNGELHYIAAHIHALRSASRPASYCPCLGPPRQSLPARCPGLEAIHLAGSGLCFLARTPAFYRLARR